MALTERRAEVLRSGRAAAEADDPRSFYTRPNNMEVLTSFDDGVAAALRRHFLAHGLPGLAEQVDQLESLGRRLRRNDAADLSVSDVVYQMH